MFVIRLVDVSSDGQTKETQEGLERTKIEYEEESRGRTNIFLS